MNTTRPPFTTRTVTVVGSFIAVSAAWATCAASVDGCSSVWTGTSRVTEWLRGSDDAAVTRPRGPLASMIYDCRSGSTPGLEVDAGLAPSLPSFGVLAADAFEPDCDAPEPAVS